jgi:hypothetical protein
MRDPERVRGTAATGAEEDSSDGVASRCGTRSLSRRTEDEEDDRGDSAATIVLKDSCCASVRTDELSESLRDGDLLRRNLVGERKVRDRDMDRPSRVASRDCRDGASSLRNSFDNRGLASASLACCDQLDPIRASGDATLLADVRGRGAETPRCDRADQQTRLLD